MQHISLKHERLLTMAQASKILPPFGDKPVHPSTIWRWCTKGLYGKKLEFVKVGSRYCTSEEALDRFINRDNEDPVASSAPTSGTTPIETSSALVPMNSRLDATSQRLAQEGI